jgi:hypothetical protein
MSQDQKDALHPAYVKMGAEPAAPAVPFNLEDSEQYRMQMAAICTAALGYWSESEGIKPEYDTPALRDVAKLYAKYEALGAPAVPVIDAPRVEDDQWIFDLAAEHEERGNGLYGPVTFSAEGLANFVHAAIARQAQPTDELRKAVREMARMLEAREWAEHVSSDPDAAALEGEITNLVGLYNELREKAQPTDLSKRLRQIASEDTSPYFCTNVPKDDLRAAADEIDRYYGGMLAWKQTAEKKDRDWNEARMARENDRVAVRAQPTDRDAVLSKAEEIARCYDQGTPEGHAIADAIGAMKSGGSTTEGAAS